MTDTTLVPTAGADAAPPRRVDRRLVIVVRADPVICGHSGEARNLAEAALDRGFDEVRIVTWPIDRLQAAGLPLKPLDRVMPYRDGVVVERDFLLLVLVGNKGIFRFGLENGFFGRGFGRALGYSEL